MSTAVLPPTGLEGSQSYLTLREAAAAEASTFVAFLIVFGMLGLAVAVLIVANVVSGAVVAGFRHIGVLKALGFTPGQVMAVYLTMVSVPAVAGCVLGIGLGNLLARPLLSDAFQNFGASSVGVGAVGRRADARRAAPRRRARRRSYRRCGPAGCRPPRRSAPAAPRTPAGACACSAG